MKKPFLLSCCFFFVASTFLFAQDAKSFSLDLSLKLGYSNFFQTQSPFNSPSGPQSKTKGQLAYGLGIGIAKTWNQRMDWSAELQIYHGNFQHRLEDLTFATDLINSFNDPQAALYKANFKYWNLEVPVLLAINSSTAPNTYSLFLGFGIAKNLSSNGTARMIYGDGTEKKLEAPVYQPSTVNTFAQLGFGKKIPFATSNKSLLFRILGKYYFFQEGLRLFEIKGHLFNTHAELVFRF